MGVAMFTCDGCGLAARGAFNGRNWTKPYLWFARTSEDGKAEVHACSRECVRQADEKRGERVSIIPI